MKYLTLITIIFFSFSCTREIETYSHTSFINTTNHNIKVSGYKNGIEQSSVSFELLVNETKEVFSLTNKGLSDGITYGGINHPIDSFLVVFDGIYKIAHYKPNQIGSNPKNYLYNSKRNIYNDTSYIGTITKQEGGTRTWRFKYTFIEQDYLDAR